MQSNDSGRDQSDNRRSFLKKVSSAGAIGVTSLTSTPVGASSNASDVREVTDPMERNPLIAQARRSEEYRTFEMYFNRQPRVHISQDDVSVHKTEAGGEAYYTVTFPLEDGNEDTHSDLAFALADGNVITAQAAIGHYEDGEPTSVESFEIEDGEVTAETMDLPPEGANDDVSVQYSECEACIDLYNIACAVGCSVGLATLCLLAGLTGVGGIACTAIAAAVCYLVGKYGCVDVGVRATCAYEGYC